MSLKIVIITKYGVVNDEYVKNISSDEDCVQKMFKKCGFKKVDDFCLQYEYSIPDSKSKQVKVFGKKTGRAMCEYKY